ncbi:MAG: hypothetical protein M1835_003643 [Candelina submexicana]|nr:MAG: hypothetical protein M1835_003643 [Candelina submexicana]
MLEPILSFKSSRALRKKVPSTLLPTYTPVTPTSSTITSAVSLYQPLIPALSHQATNMYLLRRTAVRAISSPSPYILSQPRSLTTCTNSILRNKEQSLLLGLQRRFASDDVESREQKVDQDLETGHTSSTPPPTSADQDDHSTVASAISSATSSAASKVSSAAEKVGEYAESARDSVADHAQETVAYKGSRSQLGRNTEPTKNIYVGNLFFDVTEDDLRKEAERIGVVNNLRIIYDGRGLSKGFGYIEFDSVDTAVKAMQQMDQQVFQGRRMTVQYVTNRNRDRDRSGTRTRNPPSKTLFIGNMSFEMSDKDLNDLFREIRNVLDVRVAIDRRSGQPRGFAHADFVDTESAVKAMQFLNDKEVHGRRLRVDFSGKAGPPSREQMAGPE